MTPGHGSNELPGADRGDLVARDPHKATHTAVAISSSEQELSRKKVRSGGNQAEHLLAWAEPFETRTWAIEPAGGLGYLLAQQLVAAGEAVVDVPATLASRVPTAERHDDRRRLVHAHHRGVGGRGGLLDRRLPDSTMTSRASHGQARLFVKDLRLFDMHDTRAWVPPR